MKKSLLSVLLSTAMVISLCVPASATEAACQEDRLPLPDHVEDRLPLPDHVGDRPRSDYTEESQEAGAGDRLCELSSAEDGRDLLQAMPEGETADLFRELFLTGETATGEIATGETATGEIATGETASGEFSETDSGIRPWNIEQGDLTDEVPAVWDINSDPASWTTAGRLVEDREPFLTRFYMNYGNIISSTDPDHDTRINAVNFWVEIIAILAANQDGVALEEYKDDGGTPNDLSDDTYYGFFDLSLSDYEDESDIEFLSSISVFFTSMFDEYGYVLDAPADPDDVVKEYYDPAEVSLLSSPFSYFFNSPEEARIVNGKVLPMPGGKETDPEPELEWIYRAVDVGTDGLYALVRYAVDEESGRHIFEKTSDGVKEINTRYRGEYGDEPCVTYCGLKHVCNKGKKRKMIEDFDIDIVLVRHDGEAKTTSLVKGLDIRKVKFRNNLSASVPSVLFNEKGEQAAQLTANENRNFKGQPSFTIVPSCKAEAAQYKAEITKALKESVFFFEIRQKDIGGTGDFLIGGEAVPDYDEYGMEIPPNPWSWGAIYTFPIAKDEDPDLRLAEVQKTYLDKYLPAMKKLNDYGSATDDEIRTILAAENIPGTYSVPKEDGSYTGEICFFRVPLYVDPEIDRLAALQNCLPFVSVGLNTDNEKGRTRLTFNKEGVAKLTLYLDRTELIRTEETDRYAESEEEAYPVFREKTFYHRLKTTVREGGRQDVYVQSKKLEDGTPYVLLTGQNDLCGKTLLRLFTNRWGYEEIRAGHYQDEEHFYIESERNGIQSERNGELTFYTSVQHGS